MYLDMIRTSISIFKYNTIDRLNRIKKIIKILDSIDIVESNNTIFINIDKHVLMNHNGNIVINSKDGYLITKHKRTHINPAIIINTDDTVANAYNADYKALLLSKQHLFIRLLKHKKISMVLKPQYIKYK
jgi:hypothetical protein